jgi:hypothetical protein
VVKGGPLPPVAAVGCPTASVAGQLPLRGPVSTVGGHCAAAGAQTLGQVSGRWTPTYVGRLASQNRFSTELAAAAGGWAPHMAMPSPLVSWQACSLVGSLLHRCGCCCRQQRQLHSGPRQLQERSFLWVTPARR